MLVASTIQAHQAAETSPTQLAVPASPVAETEEIAEFADIVEETPQPFEPPGLLDKIGRFHPALVHFPIAWAVLLLLLDAAGLFLHKQFEDFGKWLTASVVLAALPAIFTGYLRSAHLESNLELQATVSQHCTLAISATVVISLALLLRIFGKPLEGAIKYFYLGLVGAAVLLYSLAGHLGGTIVFGVDFFKF
jgi:uncharacterized membrane protein